MLATIVALSLAGAPRRTGDSHQYIAMARQLAYLRSPSLSVEEESHFRYWLENQPAESGFPDGAPAIRQPALIRYNHQEFSHFWLYPLLVSPMVAIGNALGAHPATAFTIANAALLSAAIWAISRAFGVVSALVMLASPVVWFVARAQVEVFTFSLLSIAVAAASAGRWGPASIAAAVASTQNAPIAAIVPLFWLAGALEWALHRRSSGMPISLDGRQLLHMLAIALTATSIAALHPAYYLARLGVVTPQQLNGGIASAIPSARQILAPLIDPNIGLFVWVPVTALFWAAGTAFVLIQTRAWSVLPARTGLLLFCTAISGVWFLFVFAHTTNVNSGGTVHMTRYGMWLLPLMLPAIAVSVSIVLKWAPGVTMIVTIALALLYLGYFRPDQPERYVEQSPQAAWIMTNAPAWYQPLPEVFVERTLHIDGGARSSAANPSCNLIFILAAEPDQPCTLSELERASVTVKFASGATGVWIRRDAGTSTVSAAL